MEENIQNENYRTTTSLTILKDGMDTHLFHRTFRKVIAIIMFSLCVIFLIFYFSLPCFQSSNTTIEGLVNFHSNEIISLASLNHYQTNLSLDCSNAKNKLLENSHGAICSASFSTDGFTSKATVKETLPVASYLNDVYLNNGKKISYLEEILSQISLPDESVNRISLALKNESSQLPVFHFPSDVNVNDDILKEATSYLTDISFISLKTIDAIQFKKDSSFADSNDSHWTNFAQVIVDDGTNKYLLKDLNLSHMADYFADGIYNNQVLTALHDTVLSREDFSVLYHFEDDTTVQRVYPFLVNWDNGKIQIAPFIASEVD